MGNSQSFDLDDFKQKAMKELYAGKPLMGESGIFTPLLKHFFEATLQGEMFKSILSELLITFGDRIQIQKLEI
jgi:putative transposase